MIIKNNRFINCGYGSPTAINAMIRISGMGEKGAVAKAGNHKNILIEGNQFMLCNSMPVIVMATSGIKIRNNLFKFTHFRIIDESFGFNIDQKRVYWLYNVDDAEISRNKVENSGKYLSKEKLFSENVNGLNYSE